MTAPRWPRLTVVSPGLIGGSIARGVRARRLARHAVQSELSPAKVVTLRPAVAPGGVE